MPADPIDLAGEYVLGTLSAIAARLAAAIASWWNSLKLLRRPWRC